MRRIYSSSMSSGSEAATMRIHRGASRHCQSSLSWQQKAQTALIQDHAFVGDAFDGRPFLERFAFLVFAHVHEHEPFGRRLRVHVNIQVQLGQAYQNGTGIGRDYQQAYLWFAVAAGQTPLPDNEKALIEMRNIVAARMTPDEEARAAARAAAWRPRR